MLGYPKILKTLYNPSVDFIFHVLFHLVLHRERTLKIWVLYYIPSYGDPQKRYPEFWEAPMWDVKEMETGPYIGLTFLI